MKIKDIVFASANFLGNDRVATYIESGYQVGNEAQTVDRLVRLANLVITELSVSYVSAVFTENVTFSEGKVLLSQFYLNPLKIVSVTDLNGNEIEFSTDGVYLRCGVGQAVVTYECYPMNMGLYDEINFSNPKLGAYTVAMAVAAEYCLTVCDFDCAVVWHEKYVEQLKAITPLKNTYVKQREWL